MSGPSGSAVVNAKTCEITEPDGTLLAFLRSGPGLTGAKEGCGEGACGACTVLVDGAPVLACRTRAGDMAGRAVITIEGLAGPAGEPLHPVQRALAAERAAQCDHELSSIRSGLAVSHRWDDDNRAVRVVRDLVTDRSHQQPGEPARAARPYPHDNSRHFISLPIHTFAINAKRAGTWGYRAIWADIQTEGPGP
jgi:hypothetical protein